MDTPNPPPPTRSITATDIGLLLIRVMVGVVYIFHGSQKLFGLFGGPGLAGTAEGMGGLNLPLPMVSAVLVGLAEFVGGLSLVSGVLVRVFAWPLAFAMFVAAFWAHWGAFSGPGGMEFPLTMAFVITGLGLTGPGRLNLVELFRGGRERSDRGSL